MSVKYQNKNHKVGMYLYLLGVTVSLLFIQFPKLPFLHIAPINIFVLLLAIALIPRLGELFRIRASIKSILLCVGLFSFVDQLLNVAQDEANVGAVASIRALIILLSAATMLKTRKDLDIFLKWTLFGVITSALLGLLIYFYGGVFLDMRNWLIHDTASVSGIAGKGLWVSGLSGNHFSFGYLLAGVTVIPLTYVAMQKRKIPWLLLYLIFIVALVFNAERSATIAVVASSLYFSYRVKLFRSKRAIILLILVISASIATKNYRNPAVINNESQSKTSIERIMNTSDFVHRLKWQFYGIKSVFLHPTGVTIEEYRKVVLGGKNSSSVWIPYPHNHYLNIGMHTGYAGWILFVVFLMSLIKLINFSRKRARQLRIEPTFMHGVHIALAAVMFNALFHNNGIFFYEPMSLTLLAATFGVANWLANSEHATNGR